MALRTRSLVVSKRWFTDGASCAEFLFERRWPKGFVCPKCGSGRAAYDPGKKPKKRLPSHGDKLSGRCRPVMAPESV